MISQRHRVHTRFDEAIANEWAAGGVNYRVALENHDNTVGAC